jgi:phosphoribosyl-AMP cyclohydrolase
VQQHKTFDTCLRQPFNDQTLDNIADTTFDNMIVNATYDSASNKAYDRSADSGNKTFERNKTKVWSNGQSKGRDEETNLRNCQIDDDFASPGIMGGELICI